MKTTIPHDLVRFLKTRSAPKRLLRVGLAMTSTIYSLRPDALLAKSVPHAGASQPDWSGGGGMQPLELSLADIPVSSRGELFFIDKDVADPGAFWLAAPKGGSVVCIPADVDPWRFMAQESQRFHGLSAIHLVSHGQPGALVLNGRRYAAKDIEKRTAQLQQLGNALTKNGDIFLYGCEVGAGKAGQNLLNTMAAVTRADIAASSDDTGSSTRGGNWDLEVVTGHIDHSLVLSAKTMAGYDYVLHSASVSTVAQLKAAIATAVADSADDTITVTGNITFASAADAITVNVTDGHTLTIVGGGFTLDAAHLARAINVTAGSVAISDLTITKGLLSGNGGITAGSAPNTSLGAGISNAGTLTLTNVNVTANKASGGGGGGGTATPASGGCGAGGGGGGFSGIGGGNGGDGRNSSGVVAGSYIGVAGGGGVGGRGGSYDGIHLCGFGGSTAGGTGGSGGGYSIGGNGGVANNGSISIGGGGGGAGYSAAGGTGGNAAGGIFNSGTLTILGTSAVTSNLGAGGGGGGGATAASGYSGNGGAGGRGVGAIWNTGTLQMTSGVFSALSGNTGGGGGGGGASGGGNVAGAAGGSTADIYNLGTVNTSYTPPPSVSNATYNISTGVLAVTAANMTTGDTISISKLTITGEGGSTYALTTGSATASSATAFSVTLNATDQAAIDQIVNKNGTSSTGGTTYNLAAADDWDANVTAGDTSDATNAVTASNVAVPTITSATYDAATGALVVTGSGFLKRAGATNDIDVSKLTLTGEGGSTYTLTTTGVEITSGTSFTVTLNGTDLAAINQILNKNGTSSTGATTYNLAAAEDWTAGADSAVVVVDATGNGVTVSNVAVPTITSATYNASTGALVVTGTGFLKLNGATNDIDASRLTLTGEGGSTYSLTSTSVEITSGTSFTVTLNGTDLAAINQILNKNGPSSTGATTYNLAAAEDWAAGADAAVVIADTTGNGVTVSNVAVPTVTSATYDASTGVLVVTGTGLLKLSGAANDINVAKLSISGDSTAYTLTTANVEITSGTSFTVTLNGTDKSALLSRLNKNGTSSNGAVTYNLAAAEDWAVGADTAVVVADLTGNGITVSNVNVAPTISNLNGDAASYVEGASAVLLDSGTAAIVADADSANFNTGSLTASITANKQSSEDVLGINTSGTVSLSAGMAVGSTVSVSGTPIGVIATAGTGSGTDDLIVTLNSNATPALVTTLVQALTYLDSNSTQPDTSARTVSVTVSDGAGGTSNSAAISVSVAGVNNAPTLSTTGGTPTYTENGAAVDLFSGVSISTVESSQTIVQLTLTVSNLADGSSEILRADGTDITLTNGTSGTSGTTAGNTLSYSVSVTGSIAAVTLSKAGGMSTATATTVVDGLSYRNSSDAPTTASRVATLTGITDSGGTGNGGLDTTILSIAATIGISAINDAPAITAPGSISVTEDVTTALTGISFSDVDAGSSSVTITLSVGSGSIVAAGGGGVTVGGTTSALTLTGSIANINTFIAASNVSFLTASNATSNVTLTVGIDDGGNTGSGGAQTASTYVTLSVTAVNDAPVNSMPGAQSLNQDASLTFSSGGGNLINVSDVDIGGGLEQVTLTATNGTITLSGTTGLSFSVGSGTTDATMTFAGTIANINTALSGMIFTPTAGYNGSATLQITTNDQGNTGSGGAKTDTDTINITVNPINPVVVNVSSTTANGTYKFGDSLALTITFDMAVTVNTGGGTPTLLLETGSVDRAATYTSGSGTNTLTFTYTVQGGDISADLDYQSTAALVLNGATIRDAGSLDAVLTLPVVGGANSIAGQKALVVDGATAAPVLATPATGSTDNVSFEINFTLPEAALAGSVKLTFIRTGGTVDAGSPHVVTLANGFASTGVHAASLNAANFAGDSNVASVSGGAALVDGAIYTATLSYQDAIGNTAASASSTSVTYDNATIAPVLTTPAANGTDNATFAIDFTLPEAATSGSVLLTFTRTGGATDASSPHVLTLTNSFASAGVHAATLNAANFATDTSVASLTGGATLADGTIYTVTISYQDAIGNMAATASNLAVTYDNSVANPPAPNLNTGSDSGSSASDHITNVSAPAIDGMAEPGATVRIYDGATLIGTVTANISTGVWSFTLGSALASGTHAITAIATDLAGNVSSASTSLSLTIDTASPTITTIIGSPMSGTSLNASSTLTVTANLNEAITWTGSTNPTLALTAGSTPVTATYTSGKGTTAIVFTATIPVLASTTTLSVTGFSTTPTLTDIAGNSVANQTTATSWTGTPTLPTWTINDGVAPAAPVITTASGPTASAKPSITGTAEAAATIKVYDGATLLGTTTASGTGAWTFTPTSALTEGAHTITATATDAASNTSPASAAITLTVDTIAPAAPVISNASGNTTVKTPTLTGTAEAAATVKLYDGTTLIGTTTATGTGTWSFTLSTALADGVHSITATATDAAGNTGVASAALLLNVGTVPTITAQPVALTVTAGSSATLTVSAAGTPTLTYQWQRSVDNTTFTAVSGATSTSHTLASATVAASGYYRVVVTNTFGSVTSSSASLSVTPNFAAPKPDGYAATVTGGGSGTSVVVLTAAAFQTQATSATAATITVVGQLNIGTVNVASNKTIQGADGNATLVGNLNLATGVSNVIVRGLNISNPGTTIVNGAYTDGGDGITIAGARNVFITHCTFFDCADHALKITTAADNVTVSWSEFYYTTAQTVHRYSMLIGNPATETMPIHVSLHHNLWSTRVDQRMPYSTFGYVHFYSNVFATPGNAAGSEVSDQGQFLSERNVYTGVNNPLRLLNVSVSSAIPNPRILALDNVYNSTAGATPYAGSDAVFTPTYSYEALPTSDVTTVVTANAGNDLGAGYSDGAVGSAIVTGPTSAVPAATAFTLTAVPTGFTAATYQWRFNNIAITGATSATYTVASAQGFNAGVYTVAIGFASGDMVVSSPLAITVGSAPGVDHKPSLHGGGALSEWCLGALAALFALRACYRNRRRSQP